MKTTLKAGIFIAMTVVALASCDFSKSGKPVVEDTTTSTSVTGIEGDNADASIVAVTTTTGTAE